MDSKQPKVHAKAAREADSVPRANMDLSLIEALLYPASVAVVGASADSKNFPNGIFVPNLLRSGYKGRIYPVNIKSGIVAGLSCYSSLREIPEPIDLAYIVVPGKAIPSVIEDCIANGARSAIAIASNVEADIIDAIRNVSDGTKRFRFCGPNSEGIINSALNLNLTFVDIDQSRFVDGDICLLSQSGGIAASIAQTLWQNHAGVSYSLSVGNCIDLDFGDYMDFCASDRRIKVVGLYLEGITKATIFVDAVRRLAFAHKPLVILKPHDSPQVQEQVKSHTHSLSGREEVFDAFLKKYGMVRANDLRELCDILTAFSWQPIPRGSRCGIVGDTGGYTILLSDVLERHGLRLARLSVKTEELIGQAVGEARSKISCRNPVDTDAAVPEPDIPSLGCIVAGDVSVDAVVIVMVGPFAKGVVDSLRSARIQITQELGKPIFCVFSGCEIDGSVSKEITSEVREIKIPVYSNPEDIGSVIKAMVTFGESQRRLVNVTNVMSPKVKSNKALKMD